MDQVIEVAQTNLSYAEQVVSVKKVVATAPPLTKYNKVSYLAVTSGPSNPSGVDYNLETKQPSLSITPASLKGLVGVGLVRVFSLQKVAGQAEVIPPVTITSGTTVTVTDPAIATITYSGTTYTIDPSLLTTDTVNADVWVSAEDANKLIQDNTLAQGYQPEVTAIPLDPADLTAAITAAAEYGNTLVSSGDLNENAAVIDELTANPSLYFMANDNPTDLLLANPQQGVMADELNEGKAVYAITTMLAGGVNLTPQNQIKGNFGSGVAGSSQQQAYYEQGYSFYGKADSGTWLRSLQFGKRQASVIYYELMVIYEIRVAVANFIESGKQMVDNDLLLLRGVIYSALTLFAARLKTKATVFTPTVSSIPIASQVAGNVVGVKVTFEIGEEILAIDITAGGL